MVLTRGPFRPLVRVGLPVAVAVLFVLLAIINVALVKTWGGEYEDGVLWRQDGANVVAADVAPGLAGAQAELAVGDVLLFIDGHEIRTPADVFGILHAADASKPLSYALFRAPRALSVSVLLTPMPLVAHGLYFSLALVGILSLLVGASVRLRRPNDPATLHFFWLTVAFFGVLAFTPSGRYDRLDYFFEWADMIARFVLPPLFLHFAFVFPERPTPWAHTAAGRIVLTACYIPAVILGVVRVLVVSGRIAGIDRAAWLERIEWFAYLYLAIYLVGGLVLMMWALRRHRSATARRQLRWIVWGSSVGALPFVVSYILPFLFHTGTAYTEYTAVLLGCIPFAFASAIVRYRLMDVEVILKKALGAASVALVLTAIYFVTLELLNLTIGVTSEQSSFWALLATLVVALVAPSLWTAIQAALDRLHYRGRYDYRRALVAFARELTRDLDLRRLSTTLVDRIRETLGADRVALFLAEGSGASTRFSPVATAGLGAPSPRAIDPSSSLGLRLLAGHPMIVDDPVPARRLTGEDATEWKAAGLYNFVPCVSNDTTIAVIAIGRRPHSDPLSSEDMALLVAVAAQAATAIENARLYQQLSGKADEIERLRQFSDSVVESLTAGLVVVDLKQRILRWNRRMETLTGRERAYAHGRELDTIFGRPFIETLAAARRESPHGTTLYRVPLEIGLAGEGRSLLVNVAVSPFEPGGASPAGWIIVLEDVTDRANLEEQLQLSEKMAAIGLLAAGVAHEVNTPLTGISSFTQMLLERASADDPSTQLLEKIEQQTFRAAKIVSSLLNLARPSDGETGPVDLNVVISDILALLEHQFKMSRIQVRRRLAAHPVVVHGMEYKLQQVFLNLFLNARDAMAKGGWLSLSTAIEGDTAIVDVSDTGIGIPPEHLARIYDPFFTTKADGRGTGLGLSVTYGIVREHGGTLTCESDVKQGTRFRLVLPLGDRSATDSDQAATP